MISYKDTLINGLTKDTVFKPLNKSKNDLHCKYKTLLFKILKHNRHNQHYEHISNEIVDIICQNSNLSSKLIKIDNLITKYNLNKFSGNINNHHLYIVSRLIDIFCSNKDLYNINSNSTILDIGGGNGDILNILGDNFNIVSNNLYCLEQSNDNWSESYSKTNNVTYITWDNHYLDLPDNSIDLIIIMVTIHHMSDETIYNLLKNIQRILKKDGYVIIKEHNMVNYNVKQLIDWEHHLYHLMSDHKNTNINIDKYIETFINNYKSKEDYDQLFDSIDLTGIQEYNRQLENKNDDNNVTNLYWKIYRKSD
jgi:ubiquinone/menaquinone biosynthesis C-methylase UbiE